MKKITKFLCVLALATGMAFTPSITNALQVSSDGIINLPKHIIIDESEHKSTQNLDNGLTITFGSPIYKEWFDSGKPDALDKAGILYCRRGLAKVKWTQNILGQVVTFTNHSDAIRIISWKDSSMSMGRYNGIVAFPNMKFKDFGDPSKLADMILAPGQSITTTIYAGYAQFSGREWFPAYFYIRTTEKSNAMTLNLKILDENGNGVYRSITSPYLVVDQDYIKSISIK